jgi:hypothetical protein
MLDDDHVHYRGLAQYVLAYLLRAEGEADASKAAAERAQASFGEGGGRSQAEDGLADFMRGEDVPPVY